MSRWSYLLNADHINRVIASTKASPDEWSKVKTAQWEVARDPAWNILIEQRQWAVMEVIAQAAGWSVAQPLAQAAGYDAILALIAYDDCAYMLDSDPSELAILAKLGDHRAILLLPACKVFHALKELA